MKVIVTSDAHGNLKILKQIYEMNKDADLFLDAGDSERSEEDIFPFKSVSGNWDYLIRNQYRVEELGGVKIYVTHGFGLMFDINRLIKNCKNLGCDIGIFGHIHHPYLKEIDGIILLNPGSVSIPRGASRSSYAIITFNNKEDINIEIKEI